MSQDESKQQAARAALEYLPERGIIGLGTGSTARYFIQGVGELVKRGRDLRGVPTSAQSREQAEALGIPLLPDEGPWKVDVCVDGADEISAALDVIKGGGGCQTREKIVNHASSMNIIVVDESKLSTELGEKWPVPVEVLAFGHQSTASVLSRYGEVALRMRKGTPWLTDAGNYIYDVRCGVIADPAALDQALCRVPGVVETGLFCQRANLVIVAGSAGVRTLKHS